MASDSEYSLAINFNRQQFLRFQLQQSNKENLENNAVINVQIPPRLLTSNWPYYRDNTVFGENYETMQVITSEEGEHPWKLEVRKISIIIEIYSFIFLLINDYILLYLIIIYKLYICKRYWVVMILMLQLVVG